jgi:hypothetical protein
MNRPRKRAISALTFIFGTIFVLAFAYCFNWPGPIIDGFLSIVHDHDLGPSSANDKTGAWLMFILEVPVPLFSIYFFAYQIIYWTSEFIRTSANEKEGN